MEVDQKKPENSYSNPGFISTEKEEQLGNKINFGSHKTQNATEDSISSKKRVTLVINEKKENEGRNRNPLIRLIQNHYRTNPVQKSPSQLQSEAYLLPGGLIPFNRWFLMPAAIITQFCCGSLYAWSVFNKPIDTHIYGHIVNMAPITFYIAVGCFGCSAAVMGPWLERHGPRRSLTLGSILFLSGHLLTALALYLKQMWLVYIGYGVCCGCGIGLGYISPVSVLQKWFPDKRGLASGFAVCGFGAGSIAISKIQFVLISSVGLSFTFITLGCSYFVLMLCCAVVLRTPPPRFNPQIQNVNAKVTKSSSQSLEKDLEDCCVVCPQCGLRQDEGNGNDNDNDNGTESAAPMSLIEAITSKTYRLMYIMFFADTLFGLVIISRLSNLITDVFGRSPEEASTIVSINGGFNLGGRLVMSIASDWIGRKNCFVAALSIQLLILGTFSTITNNGAYWAFLLSMWSLTACYGAGFGLIPAFLTDKFGSSNIGACHGLILTAWSVAGVAGGLIFTAIFDKILKDGGLGSSDPWPYNVNVWWIFVVVCLCWGSTLCIIPTDNDSRFIKMIKGNLCCCVCMEMRKGNGNITPTK